MATCRTCSPGGVQQARGQSALARPHHEQGPRRHTQLRGRRRIGARRENACLEARSVSSRRRAWMAASILARLGAADQVARKVGFGSRRRAWAFIPARVRPRLKVTRWRQWPHAYVVAAAEGHAAPFEQYNMRIGMVVCPLSHLIRLLWVVAAGRVAWPSVCPAQVCFSARCSFARLLPVTYGRAHIDVGSWIHDVGACSHQRAGQCKVSSHEIARPARVRHSFAHRMCDNRISKSCFETG